MKVLSILQDFCHQSVYDVILLMYGPLDRNYMLFRILTQKDQSVLGSILYVIMELYCWQIQNEDETVSFCFK